MGDYDDFRVLLDDPAAVPGLGWPEYAGAFAEIIERSKPQFAIGIFGDWGSGKTTLMRAIWRDLENRPDVVRVWFNAWRYEREEHLIVPMLDTLREGLVRWADQSSAAEPQNRARQAAETVGRAARALLAGFSLRARVPLGVAEFEATLDPGEVMAAFKEKQARDDPSSFYHASFNAMKEAVGEFVEGGIRRVVVFIDDLDRCLPLSALEVLESMKLFFDLEGFVFVVGLDQQVIERSVEMKYRTSMEPAARGDERGVSAVNVDAHQGTPIDGAAYIKKIFQVSLGLPRIGIDQVEEFFDKLVENADLPASQRANFNAHVRRHLPYLAGDAPVNPREVKRLLNAYTIQLKMLSARGLIDLDPDVALALQAVGFRRDWQEVYDRLTTEPELVIDEIRSASADRDAGDATVRIPRELLDYLADAAPNLVSVPLGPYISSARSVGESDIGLLEAHTQVARMLRRLDDLAPGESVAAVRSEFRGGLGRLFEELQRRNERATARGALAVAQRLDSSMKRLDAAIADEDLEVWIEEARRSLDEIDDALRVLRRQTSVRAVAG
jgi:hypothetical protein